MENKNNNLQFEIETEIYQGPLDKLLSLIEEKKLEITEISLAKIADDFLLFLSSLKKKNIEKEILNEIIADFLVVAAKLLLIKSRTILPSEQLEEEEEGIGQNLEEQLKLYQEFKIVSQKIGFLFQKKERMFSRPPLAEKRKLAFLPGKTSVADLHREMKKFINSLEGLNQDIQKRIKEKKINLAKKINSLYQFLKKVKIIEFNKFFQKKNPPIDEIIASFLAILHLFSQEKIIVEQKELFGKIKITLKEE